MPHPASSLVSAITVFALAVAVCLSGCSSAPIKSESNRGPVQPAGSSGDVSPATSDSSREVLYNLPVPAQPQGSVAVRSLGRLDLKRESISTTLPAVAVRVTIHNDTSDLDWQFDSRLAQVKFGGPGGLAGETRRALFARSAENADLPFVRVPRGKTLTVDLYYAVPPDSPDGSTPRAPDVQSFSLDWQIVAGESTIHQQTEFSSIASDLKPLTVGPFAGPAERNGTVSATTMSLDEPTGEPGVKNPAPMTAPKTDWWQDPFAELPPSWRDLVQ